MDMVTEVSDNGLAMTRVKFVGNYKVRSWLRQFPGGDTVWGGCRFIFDLDAREYDWFVVYNDLPSALQKEQLCCPKQQTILVTNEPSNIKCYGKGFTGQFGHVLTSQEPWALPHPGHIYSQSGLQWYYGIGKHHELGYDAMSAHPPLDKTRGIATVCSQKQMGHTLHKRRFDFVDRLRKIIPELDVYGHGMRWIDDKAEALDSYRYHIAIENFAGKHHWTEKLADAYLGVTLPFYYGCTNLEEYFPAESFIRIDIDDVAGSSDIIRRAMAGGEFEKRLPFILEARRRVMEEYNLFALLARLIGERTAGNAPIAGGAILSRRLLRRNPLIALQDFIEKCRMGIINNNRSRRW
jgi:hypothetical protein